MGYIWACQQTGYPDVNMAVVRGIAILKRDFNDAIVPVQFPQFLIDRWYNLLLYDLNQIVEAYNSFTAYPKPDAQWYNLQKTFPYNFADSCSSYGGCAFSTLCLAKDPEPFFSNYVKHRWNPLNKQPVEEL